MEKPLKLVLTDHWFEEIKSGRKTHEYRKATPYWRKRIVYEIMDCLPYSMGCIVHYGSNYDYVEFQKAYRKNPERMTFHIKKVNIINGKNTDLKIDEDVIDIELGKRIK